MSAGEVWGLVAILYGYIALIVVVLCPRDPRSYRELARLLGHALGWPLLLLRGRR